MSLETGNYLSNLVSSNPTGSDRKLQGDDHLRLIKSTLQNSFAGITGPVVVGGVNGGVANAYTLTPTPPLPSYVDNMSIVFSPTVANTGASTMNISGLGAVSIQSVSGAALAANDLVVGQKYRATFDGTNFRLFSVTKNYIDQLAFSSALPAQSLGFLASTGSVAAFTRTFNGYAVDESKGANVASASTIDLQNTVVTGNLIHITGTTTITAMTLPAGAERTLVFDGILTLTHSVNLDLPGAANITTAVGDRAIVRGEGSGAVRVVSYMKASGRAVIEVAPGLVRLTSPLTPSVAATVDFLSLFTSTYDNYRIIVNGVRPGVTDSLILRLAVSNAADSTSNYYGALVSNSANSSALTSAPVAPTVFATGGGYSGVIDILNVNDSARNKQVLAGGAYQTNATPAFIGTQQHTQFNKANVVTGFQLLWSSGNNFDAIGSIIVFGYAKS